jgi:hypothetical protein
MDHTVDENMAGLGSSVCICPDFSMELCRFDATQKTTFRKEDTEKMEHVMMRLVP